jgi:phage-related protein
MPVIGTHCHELRIQDRNATWRIVYRVDADAIVVVDVFSKKTQRTPPSVLRICRARLRQYDSDCGE